MELFLGFFCHGRHDVVGNIEICRYGLDVVVIVKRFHEFQDLFTGVGIQVNRRRRDASHLFDGRFEFGIFECLKQVGIVVRFTDDFEILALLLLCLIASLFVSVKKTQEVQQHHDETECNAKQ